MQKPPKSPLKSKDPKIQAQLNKAKQLEQDEFEKEDVVHQDEQFKKDSNLLRRLLKPLWFMNKEKHKSSEYIKK